MNPLATEKTGSRTRPDVEELLLHTRVEVAPATYVLVGMRHDDWSRLLTNPELSPRADASFMVLRDGHEVTLLLEEADWQTMRHAARDSRVEDGFRLLTLDQELDWNVVGYLARVTRILADEGVSIGALTAFSRDHLLVKQDELGRALRALSRHVEALC